MLSPAFENLGHPALLCPLSVKGCSEVWSALGLHTQPGAGQLVLPGLPLPPRKAWLWPPSTQAGQGPHRADVREVGLGGGTLQLWRSVPGGLKQDAGDRQAGAWQRLPPAGYRGNGHSWPSFC